MKEVYIDEHGKKMIKMSFDDIKAPTSAQVERARKAAGRPNVHDADCPPMSEKMQKRMRKRIKELHATKVVTA